MRTSQTTTGCVRRTSPSRLVVFGAAIAIGAGSLIALGGSVVSAATVCGSTGVLHLEGGYDQCAYDTPGTDLFTPPSGVGQVSVGAIGAQGGTNSHQVSPGGAGENVSAFFHISGPLYVDVGAPGGAGAAAAGGAGGQNGTTVGAGGTGGFLASSVTAGGGGGGSSDLRAVAAPDTRLLVAAGGGGAGDNGGTGDVYGGGGGAGGTQSSGVDGFNGLATDTRDDIDGQMLSTPPAQGGHGATSAAAGAGGDPGATGEEVGATSPNDEAEGGARGLDGKGLTGDAEAGDGGEGAPGVATANAAGAGGGSGGGGGGGYLGGGGGGSAGSTSNTAGGVGGAGGGGGGGTSFAPQFASYTVASSSGALAAPASGRIVIDFAASTPTTSATAAPGSGPVGTKSADSVQLSGSGAAPTGSISFALYAATDSTCSSPLVGSTSTVTVSGSNTYQSTAFAPTTAGTYYWNYSYSGDLTYVGQAGTCAAASQKVTVGGTKPLPPSNKFELGKPVKHPTTGTATVVVTVPDAGKLVLGGTGVHHKTLTTKKKTKVSVPVAAAGAALTTLKKHHKVLLHTAFTFTPLGGSSRKHTLTVELVKPKPPATKH